MAKQTQNSGVPGARRCTARLIVCATVATIAVSYYAATARAQVQSGFRPELTPPAVGQAAGSIPAPLQPPPNQPLPEPVAMAGTVQPKRDETIADVRVQGNQGVTLQRIVTYIKTRAGRAYDPILVEDDVRRLEKSHLFVAVNVTYQRAPDGTLIIIYQVVERPTIRYVRYVGNKVKKKTLDKQSNLKQGDALDPFTISDAKRKIEEYYNTKGYGKARVTLIEGDKPGDRGVVFLINEGQKQRVWKIDFKGNEIASDGRLKTQIKSRTPILWVLKGEVDREKIDADVDRLKSYYRGLGFFSARVGREMKFNEEQNHLTLTFVIDEGPRYKVDSITLIGNKKFQTPELQEHLHLKAGQYFDQKTMQSDVGFLQDKYGSVGYIFANVEPEPRLHEIPGHLDLVYHFEEGDRYRIGRIDVHIEGDNPRTRRHTIMNRISVHPGEIADIRKLRDSERRLKGSGLFLNKPQEGIEPKLVWQKPELNDDGSGGGDSGGGSRAAQRRSNVRGQSPDDDEPEWRPGPGESDRPIILRMIEVPTIESPAEEPLKPLVVRAQSPVGQYSPPQYAQSPYTPPQYAPQQYAAPQYPSQAVPAQYSSPQYVPGQYALPQTAQPPAYAGQVPLNATGPDVIRSSARPAAQPSFGAAPQYTAQAPAGYGTQSYPPATLPPSYAPPTSTPGYGNPVTSQPGYSAPAGGGAPRGYGYDSPDQLTNPGGLQPTNTQPYGAAPTGTQPYGASPYGAPQYGQSTAPAGYGAPGYGNTPGAAQPSMLGPPSAYTSPPIGSGPPVYGGPSPAAAVGSNVGIAPSGRIFDEEPTRNVDIAATVQEAQTGRLMLGIGVNSSSGLTGTATIEEQNFDWRRIPTSLEDIRSGNAFRGAGQQFRIQAMPGTQVSQYSATFREPYLFDSLFSLSLNAQFYNRFYANWTEQRAGGSVGVGRQLTPDLQAMFRLRGENVVIYNPTYPTPQELSQVVGSNDLFTFKFDLIHDTRDSSFLASQGHYLDLSYEQAFGQFTYPRFMIDARQHFLLHQRADRSGRHTLTLMTQLGFSGSNTPIFENFFAGGYQTLRGFYFRGASPIDPTTQVVVGGDFMWVNTIEYMFPITPDDMFRGVVFCDYGTVEQQVALYSNSFRVSPGAGLRLTIPAMGPAPIALDFAAPVMFMHGDQIQTFSFFVGTQR